VATALGTADFATGERRDFKDLLEAERGRMVRLLAGVLLRLVAVLILNRRHSYPPMRVIPRKISSNSLALISLRNP